MWQLYWHTFVPYSSTVWCGRSRTLIVTYLYLYNHLPNFVNFLCLFRVSVALFLSGGGAISCVVLVWLMISYLRILEPMVLLMQV